MLKDNPAHDEIRDRLDAALAATDGITIEFPTASDATAFRMTAYAIKRKDAYASLKLYPPHDAAYGRSPYDELVMRLLAPNVVHISLRKPIPPAKPTPDQA